jgi:hypothetical protein
MQRPALVHVVVAAHESGYAAARHCACALGVIVLFNFHSRAVVW